MTNEELLARIDERLQSTSKNVDEIYKQTSSMDDRLRDVEISIMQLQAAVNDIPDMKTNLKSLNAWREQLGGSWKAIVVISLIFSAIATGLIQYFND